jgi:hypothetical protein
MEVGVNPKNVAEIRLGTVSAQGNECFEQSAMI